MPDVIEPMSDEELDAIERAHVDGGLAVTGVFHDHVETRRTCIRSDGEPGNCTALRLVREIRRLREERV